MSKFNAREYIKKKYSKSNEKEDEKNKTTKESKSTSFNARDYISEKYRKQKADGFGLDTLESDLNSLGKTVKSIYEGWQTEETMNNTRSSIEAMQERISAYEEYRKQYGGGADLSEISKEYEGILGEWDDLSDKYRRHKSAKSYKKALKEAEIAEANRKKQETEDTDALQLEIDEWQSKYDAAKKEHDEWEIPIGMDEAATKSTGVITYYPQEAATAAEKARDETIKKKYGYSLEELKKMVGEKTAYLNNTKYIQDGIKSRTDALNSKNFDKYSAEGLKLGEDTFGKNNYKSVGSIGMIPEPDKYKQAAIAMSQFANGEEITDDSIYKNATEEEFQILAYWRQYDEIHGTSKAYDYVDYIEESLNEKKGAATAEKYKSKSDLSKILYGVGAGLDQFATGIDNALNFSDDYIPINSTQYASQIIRDQLWDSGPSLPDWLGGSSLGQIAYDTTTTTANMAPSILAGVASDLVVPGSGTYVTSGLMGLSASGNAYQQMLNQGYNKQQSRTYATLVGLSEATLSAALSGVAGGKVTEKAIQNAIKGIDKGFLRFAVRWGMSGISEVPEESMQAILEPMFQNIALGYEKNTLDDTDWSQVAYEGLLGGLSGFALGGGRAATDTIVEQSTWTNSGKGVKTAERTSDMLDVAKLTPKESDAYKIYNRYANKGINADNISDVQLGRLYTTTKEDALNTIKSKKASNVEKYSAFETLGKLKHIDTDNVVKKNRDKLNVGEETVVAENNADINGIKLGEKTTLVTSEGEVSVDDVTLSEKDASIVAYAQTMSEPMANLFIEQYDGNTDVEAYANSFNLVSAYAEHNYDQNTIIEKKGVLSTDQVKAIYNATVKASFNAKQTKLDEISEKQGKTMFVQGTLDDSIIDYNSKTTDGSKINWNSLTSRQRAAIKFTKMFTKATGVNVKFIKSEVVDGKHKGKNGSYDPETNTIEIDVYAGRIDVGTAKETIIPTLSHEMTHWMKAKAISAYEGLRNDILKTLSEKNGISSDDLIDAEMVRMKKAHPDMDVTPEKAIDEIVARSCADMLSDSKKARELLKMMSETEQQGFIEKVKETFENLMKWIDKLIAEYKNEDVSGEAKFLREYKEDLQRIQAQWDKMFVEAVKMNQALQQEGVTGEQVVGELAGANESHSEKQFEDKQNPNIANYTETQYNNFGWVRYNNVLSAAENNTLLSRYADYKHNKNSYPTTSFGEAVIFSFDYPDVVMYVKGTIKSPKIISIVRINAQTSNDATFIQKEIIENEYLKATSPYETITNLFGEGILTIHKKRDYLSFQEYQRREKGKGSKANNPIGRIKQDGTGSNQQSGKIDESNQGIKYSDRDTLEQRHKELQDEYNALNKEIEEIKNSEKYKYFVDSLATLEQGEELDNAIKEYGRWTHETGLYAKSKRMSEIVGEQKDIRASIEDNDKMTRDAYMKSIEELHEMEKMEYVNKAVERYGTTNTVSLASYLMLNGEMLDFSSGQGYRVQDHREISEILDMPDSAEYSDSLIAFMNMGNIRMQTYGIDISQAPNQEQRNALREIIPQIMRDNDEFTVDFSKTNGYTDGSVTYPEGTSVSKILADIESYFKTGVVPEYESSIAEFLYSDRDNDVDIDTRINQSMTMEDAKQMIQRAFIICGIEEWYDGEYKNGDEWLKAQGVDEVALYIENEYALQEKYLDKIEGINDEIFVESILEAYLNGTLVGKEKPKPKRLDMSQDYRINDKRFYSPQHIKDVKKLLSVASTRVTDKNRVEVSNARAKILLFAHNKGASELLGLTQAELNKKLRTWSGYPANARDISKRFNNGIADSNKWTGIENCSWLYRSTVTTNDLESLVKEITGTASDYEKLYIARTMLALDTHIDWSWLSFDFDSYAGVQEKYNGNSKVLGFYRNDARKIVVSRHNDAQDTVAHEMGHALDYQWARDLGFTHGSLTMAYRNTQRITDADTKQFFDNFKIFIDSLTDNSDISSEYKQDANEVFARFVAKFIQWVDNTGTGNRRYNTEYSYYKDNFNASHYIEFVKLLQEKAMLDAKRMATNEDVKFSDRDSEGNTLSKEQMEYFKDSKVRDEDGNLIPVYHGTYENFTIFDINKTSNSNIFGKGHYFTSSVQDAKNNYASGKGDVKTKINSLAYYYFEEMGYTEEDLYDNDHIREWNMAYDRAEKFYESGKVMKVYLNITNPVFANNTTELYDKNGNFISARSFEELKKLGFDGIIDYYVSEKFNFQRLGEETAHFIVFDSNQIKLTTNKNPTSNPDYRYSDRETESVYDELYEVTDERDRLLKENNKFKEDVERLRERLKLEKQVTKGNVFNKNQLSAVAGHLRKLANSDYSKPELIKMLDDVYSYIAHSEHLNWEDVFAKCYEVAKELQREGRAITETNDYAKDILEIIRSKPIALSDIQKSEIKYATDKSYQKAFWGKVRISDDGIPLDTRWQDWASVYPGTFDSDVTEGDQVVKLYNIYEDMRDAQELILEYDEEEQARWLAKEVYNQFWNVSPVRTTADKYDKQIKRLNYEHRKAMKEFRDDYQARLKEQHKADREKANALAKKIRERKDKEIAEVKRLGKERMDAYKENAERKTKIQSITANALTLNKWLVKNLKEEHIHIAMRGPVINLLQAIDFSSKQLLGMKGSANKGTPTRNDISLQKALSEVKDMMADASVGKAELIELYGHGLDDDIKELVSSVDNMMRTVGDNEFILNKMSLAELETLDKIVKTIKHSVSKMNKFHTVQHKQGIANLSEEGIGYLDKLGKAVKHSGIRGKLDYLLKWNNTIPYYAFKRLGKAGQKVFEALQDGWDKLAHNAKQITDFTNKTYSNKEVRDWGKQTKTFTINQPDGSKRTFDITIAQIMALHCVSKQEDAKRHLLSSGMTIAEFDNKGKVTSEEDNILLGIEDIATITGSLDKRQLEVANKLQEFMNTICADWGNEISMQRFAVEMFTTPDYFPIKVSPSTITKEEPKDVNDVSLFRLLNMSFTKARNEFANQSIEIGNIFDIFAQHTSDMAKYNALALPVLDVYRWYSYKGQTTIGKEYSTYASLQKALGKDSVRYFNTFMKDLNGASNVARDNFGSNFFRNAKLASVAANLRVVLLQPTAYLKASAIIDNRYLTQAFLHKPKIAKAEKYCGMALWKSMGYYDVNITKGLTEKIKHEDTWRDKTIEFSMKGAEVADKITFGYLWNACELEIRKTRKDLKVGSEEFYTTIGQRLREVIYATQVVDSTMTRSQIMRSSDGWDKMLTAFMSEPTLAYNMLVDCVITTNLDKREKGKGAFKRNFKRNSRVLIAYVTTNMLAALVESCFDVFRDDEEDEDEETLVEFTRHYLTNFTSDMSIIGKIPYLKELPSLLQGYSPSRTDTQWMESLVYAGEAWKKIFTGEGEGKGVKAVEHSLRAFSNVSGLAFFNVYRDLMAALNKLDILTAEDLEELFDELFGY